jgi:hypothetical protein
MDMIGVIKNSELLNQTAKEPENSSFFIDKKKSRSPIGEVRIQDGNSSCLTGFRGRMGLFTFNHQ